MLHGRQPSLKFDDWETENLHWDRECLKMWGPTSNPIWIRSGWQHIEFWMAKHGYTMCFLNLIHHASNWNSLSCSSQAFPIIHIQLSVKCWYPARSAVPMHAFKDFQQNVCGHPGVNRFCRVDQFGGYISAVRRKNVFHYLSTSLPRVIAHYHL